MQVLQNVNIYFSGAAKNFCDPFIYLKFNKEICKSVKETLNLPDIKVAQEPAPIAETQAGKASST